MMSLSTAARRSVRHELVRCRVESSSNILRSFPSSSSSSSSSSSAFASTSRLSPLGDPRQRRWSSSSSSSSSPSTRRVARALYRGMMRWCDELNACYDVDDGSTRPRSRPLPPPLAAEVFPDDVDAPRTTDELAESIRRAFRADGRTVADGVETLRRMNTARPRLREWVATTTTTAAAEAGVEVEADVDDDDVDDAERDSRERAWVAERVGSVDWLPSVANATNDDDLEDLEDDALTSVPLFPLGGPTLPVANDDDDDDLVSIARPLAMFLSLTEGEPPVPGATTSLRIFEPRYRRLYRDLLSKPTLEERTFAVPFPHPVRPAVWARVATSWRATRVREVADETNGAVQYLADHVVEHGKRVSIDRVINGGDWKRAPETQGQKQQQQHDRYLRVAAVVDNVAPTVSDVRLWEPLLRTLDDWSRSSPNNNDDDDALPQRVAAALRAEGPWGFVKVWIAHLRRETLRTEVQTVERLDERLSSSAAPKDFDSLAVEEQEPYRERLLSLRLDAALIVPAVLQRADRPTELVQYLTEVVSRERRHDDRQRRERETQRGARTKETTTTTT